MGKQTCRNGHDWKSRFQPSPAELRCPEPGCGLYAEPSLKAKSGGHGLQSEPESSVLAEAHGRFSTLVTEWPCFFADKVSGQRRRPGHHCWGDIDPHHLIPADFIRKYFGDLPDPELADILYAPIIGVALCRTAHEAVEARTDFIHWQELDPELVVFCVRMDKRYPERRSLLERLKVESPGRSKRGVAA